MMNLARFITMVAVVGLLSVSFVNDVAAQSSSPRITVTDATQPQHAATPRTDQAAERYPALSLRYGDADGLDQETTTETYEERRLEVGPGEDDVAERQSIDSFTSIEDGQPGGPGEFELEFSLGWETASGEHDPVTLETELEYTPDGSDFLRNMQLILAVPVEMGLGGVEGNADLEFGWQQRWVREDGMMPTLATLAEVRIPSGYHSSGVDGTLTGIIAKDCGPGTAYLNGFVKTANGDNVEDLRHFQWGAVAGYKWRVNDQFALIGDYVIKSSEEEDHANVNLLEFSGEYKVNEHLTVGPGIVIGLDDNEETPNFGAGLNATISF
ncbi:MAG: hypothetical protein ABII12_00365 [Planctomycetota bacterium]